MSYSLSAGVLGSFCAIGQGAGVGGGSTAGRGCAGGGDEGVAGGGLGPLEDGGLRFGWKEAGAECVDVAVECLDCEAMFGADIVKRNAGYILVDITLWK